MSNETSKRLYTSKAAEAWAKPSTSGIEMNVVLAEAFAEIIEEIWSQPWLGNATTRQLIEELSARIEIDGAMDYRTVDDPIDVDLDEDQQKFRALQGDTEFVEDVEEEEYYEEEIYDDEIV